MLISPIYSRWIPTADIALLYIALCLIWWLQSAASDLKWLTYLEIITPLYCFTLDLTDQIAHSLAMWHIVAVELYCTTVLYLLPQNGLRMAY